MAKRGGRTTDRTTGHGEFIARELKRIRSKPYVKVGVLEDNFTEQKRSDEKMKASATLGEVAVYNEFGTSDGRIPERSFIRATHDNKWPEWMRRTATLRRRVVSGRETVDGALGKMGTMIQTDIKKRIMSNIRPKNAPATIKRKTRAGKVGDKTLIDTAQLLGSIHWSKHDGGIK